MNGETEGKMDDIILLKLFAATICSLTVETIVCWQLNNEEECRNKFTQENP